MENPIAAIPPAERLPSQELGRLADLFAAPSVLTELIDAVPVFYLILSRTRQTVFANRALRDYVARELNGDAVGMRQGEALNCIHACETPGGCGATESCVFCGSLAAVIAGQQGHCAAEECRLIRRDGQALDLRVFSTPLRHAGESFVVLAAVDISEEKRRQTLERTFFHDVADTAFGVTSVIELMYEKGAGELAPLADAALRGARKLINEIRSQRDFMAAERGQLAVNSAPFHVCDLVSEVAGLFREQKWAVSRVITMSPPLADSRIASDRTLVGRVLSNMLKNALEASLPGETVAVSTLAVEDGIEVRVNNPQVMPEAVRRQVFHRSFSTKGEGRGLGTYGMRLLVERFLGGRVGFESLPGRGTTFWIRLPRALKPQP